MGLVCNLLNQFIGKRPVYPTEYVNGRAGAIRLPEDRKVIVIDMNSAQRQSRLPVNDGRPLDKVWKNVKLGLLLAFVHVAFTLLKTVGMLLRRCSGSPICRSGLRN